MHALTTTRPTARLTSLCYLCGMVAGPLFVVVFLVEGATRADYSPSRHPVSSLALGDLGWVQSATFVVAGLLTLAFAIALRHALPVRGEGSRFGATLVGIWAIGLIGAGVFVTDPVNGYPPGTPDTPPQYSVSGALHDLLFSLPGFLALAAACFVFARHFGRLGQPAWAVYSTATGAIFATGFVLTTLGFAQSQGFVDIAGLLQRLTVIVGWAWLTLLAVHLLRTTQDIDSI